MIIRVGIFIFYKIPMIYLFINFKTLTLEGEGLGNVLGNICCGVQDKRRGRTSRRVNQCHYCLPLN